MDEDELRIEKYSKRGVLKIKEIKPLWACGENINKVMDYSHHPESNSHKIFLVSTIEIVKRAELLGLDMTKLFTGNIASDYRIMTTLERWEKNEFVDAPSLGVSNDSKLTIPDGRHRLKLAYFMGLDKIPVAVNMLDESKLKELITIEEINS